MFFDEAYDLVFFEQAYHIQPHVALYDVDDRACEELEILANEYFSRALKTYGDNDNPELLSVMLLTVIELWVALDKITIKEIPMLANYSPEVPPTLLEQLLLSRAGNIRRLQRAHQYLSHRHSRSHRGWSVFSPSITADSFAIRFYRKSLHLQDLKSRIEGAAQHDVREKIAEL
ncbi:hypothetical protein V8E55_009853 [Tylopilus felleus]